MQLLPLGTGQEDKELLMLASHVTTLTEAFPGQHKAIPGRTRAVKPLQKARCQAGFVFLSCQDFSSPIETIYLQKTRREHSGLFQARAISESSGKM